MKANKALKRLSKMETQVSDLTKRYSASAPHIGVLLEDVKAAVVRAKDAVRTEVAAGESKKPAKKHSKAKSKTKAQAKEKAAAAPKKAANKAAAKAANAKKNAAQPKKTVKKVARKKMAPRRPLAAMAAARERPKEDLMPFTVDNLDAPSSN